MCFIRHTGHRETSVNNIQSSFLPHGDDCGPFSSVSGIRVQQLGGFLRLEKPDWWLDFRLPGVSLRAAGGMKNATRRFFVAQWTDILI